VFKAAGEPAVLGGKLSRTLRYFAA
jgi:hypothetical protein